MLTRSSRWVDVVKETNGEIGELPSDNDAAADPCSTKARSLREGLPRPDRSEIKAARSKIRSYCDNMTRKGLQQYQIEWARTGRDWKVVTRGKERPDDDAKMDLLEIPVTGDARTWSHHTDDNPDKIVSEEERRQAIEDLCSLVSQDCTTLYRPGEIFINGVCPRVVVHR